MSEDGSLSPAENVGHELLKMAAPVYLGKCTEAITTSNDGRLLIVVVPVADDELGNGPGERLARIGERVARDGYAHLLPEVRER